MVKINVMRIPDEGLYLQFSLKGNWFLDIVPEREVCDFSLQDVVCSCSARRSQRAVVIEGRIETTVDQACGRCLEVTHLSIQSTFHYTFIPADDRVLGDGEMSADDIELSYYQGEIIELDPLIFEQIILQIPMKVLCNEHCKGLCPRCGTNLNLSSCGCQRDSIDERFTILKKFKV